MTRISKAEGSQEIIDYLNLKAGRNFKATAKHRGFIQARFNEGYEIDDFKCVVNNMVRDWANDPTMYKYLRPETLFGNKFDGYLNTPAPPKGVEKDGKIVPSKNTDWRKQFNSEGRADPDKVKELLANFNRGLKTIKAMEE